MLESRKRYEAGVVEEAGLIGIHWHRFRVAKGHGHVRIRIVIGHMPPGGIPSS
jgi:hypothetical protein